MRCRQRWGSLHVDYVRARSERPPRGGCLDDAPAGRDHRAYFQRRVEDVQLKLSEGRPAVTVDERRDGAVLLLEDFVRVDEARVEVVERGRAWTCLRRACRRARSGVGSAARSRSSQNDRALRDAAGVEHGDPGDDGADDGERHGDAVVLLGVDDSATQRSTAADRPPPS